MTVLCRKSLAVLTAAFLLSITVSPSNAQVGEKEKNAKPIKAKQPLIRISKETTFVTEPVGKDGFIDYTEALDRACRKGIVAERNMARALWKAMGSSRLYKNVRYRKEFLGRLQLKYSGQTPRITTLSEFTLQESKQDRGQGGAINDEYDRLNEGPWKKSDSPRFAKWIEMNNAPLDAFVKDAAKCDQRYSPLIEAADDEIEQLVAVLLPTVQETRSMARLLRMRVLYRMGTGSSDGITDDLVALRRLSVCHSRAPSLVELLVCYAISGMADKTERQVFQSKAVSSETLKDYLKKTRDLPSLPSVYESVAIAERFMALDATQSIAKRGMKQLGILRELGAPADEKPSIVAQALSSFAQASVDWDQTMVKVNETYDELSRISKLRTFDKRAEASAAYMKKLGEEFKKAGDAKQIALRLLGGRKSLGHQMAVVVLSLVTPAFEAVHNAEFRAVSSMRTGRISLALETFRKSNGTYPADLSELTPGLLKSLPKDARFEKSYQYRRISAAEYALTVAEK